MRLIFAILPCFWKKHKFSTLQQSVRFDFDFLELERFANPKTSQPNLPEKTVDDMEELRIIVEKIIKPRCTKKECDGKKQVRVRFRVWYDNNSKANRTAIHILKRDWLTKKMVVQPGPQFCGLDEEFLEQIPGELTRKEKAGGSKLEPSSS